VKRYTLTIMLIVIVIVILGINSTLGLAHGSDSFPGKWAGNSQSNLGVQIYTSAQSYSNNIAHGMQSWEGISSNVGFKGYILSDSNNNNYHLNHHGVSLGSQGPVADALNYSRNWLGTLTACWDCEWSESRIRYNTDVYPGISTNWKFKAATHEIGHSLGLHHPDTSLHATRFDAVMKQGDLPYRVPQSHDISVLQTKYGR
jgi:hypothetical protein